MEKDIENPMASFDNRQDAYKYAHELAGNEGATPEDNESLDRPHTNGL
jgi:hypothetical protein